MGEWRQQSKSLAPSWGCRDAGGEQRRWKEAAWRQGQETPRGLTSAAGAGPEGSRGASEQRAVGQSWGVAWWEPGHPGPHPSDLVGSARLPAVVWSGDTAAP